MQKRIFAELESWLILSDTDLQNRLFELTNQTPSNFEIKNARQLFVKLLDDPSGLQISTIHAFCQSIIKKFPIEAKASPNFEIIDEQKEYELLLEARKILLQIAIDDKKIANKINLISSKLNQNSFLEITAELISKRQNLAFLKEQYFGIEGLIGEIYDQLKIEKTANENNVENSIFSEFANDQNWQKNHLVNICQNTEIKSKTAIYQFINHPVLENLDEYLSVFLTAENEQRKQLTTKPIQKQFPEAEDVMRLEQQRVLEFLEKFNSAKIANSTASLLVVVDKIITIYSALKNQNGYLDYNDLIIKTGQLLENSANREWVKYKLDGVYEHILVDESQDTNHHQWNIIKAITEDFFSGSGAQNGSRSIFVVGDEKQSIYSFQGANPDIFANIFYYYQEKLKLIDQPILNVELNSSFRSFSAILQVVDAVFSKPELAGAISVLAKKIQHNAIKNNHCGKVELLPIVSVDADHKPLENEYGWQLDFTTSEDHKSEEILAQIIAKKIKKFFDEKKFLASKNRPIEYRDVLILLKERKSGLENLLIKYLQREQVPVSRPNRINVEQEIIVQDLLAAAKFILLPEDDLNLACLLKSPLIGISEEELLEICLLKNQQKISLFVALWQKMPEMHQILSSWISQNQQQQFLPHQFFVNLLINQNVKQSILVRFGNLSVEIIDQFLKLCLDYQSNHFSPSIQGFVEFLSNANLQIKIDAGHHQNQVQITTIHGAKGLEAPIVFLTDTAHSTQKQFGNDKSRIFWDQKTDLPFWSSGKKFDNKIIEQIKQQNRAATKREYLRQLYVAMTRAEEELYVCGFAKNSDKESSESSWYSIIKEAITPFAVVKKYDFNQLLGSDNRRNYQMGEGLVVGKDFASDAPLIADNHSVMTQLPSLEFLNLSPQKSKKEIGEEMIYPSKLGRNQSHDSDHKKANLGKIIHKILEFLPDVKIADQAARSLLIQDYLANKDLSDEERKLILRKVNNVVDDPELAEIFDHPNARAEVPIIAKIDGKMISGKIDRLIIKENKVLIIDYKTGQKNDSLDQRYREQMRLYQAILQKIYPKKEIGYKIIWL